MVREVAHRTGWVRPGRCQAMTSAIQKTGWRAGVVGASLMVVAVLAVGGCSSGPGAANADCAASGSSSPAVAGSPLPGSGGAASSGHAAAGWTLPGADLANTPAVASAITS